MSQGLRRVIFFDDDCATCNRALAFLAVRLPNELELAFVPINSNLARSLLADRPRGLERDALVYLDDVEFLQGAGAIKRVLSFVPRWRVAGRLLDVLPDGATEFAYDVFAKNRHRLNGHLKSCELPSARLAARLQT